MYLKKVHQGWTESEEITPIPQLSTVLPFSVRTAFIDQLYFQKAAMLLGCPLVSVCEGAPALSKAESLCGSFYSEMP